MTSTLYKNIYFYVYYKRARNIYNVRPVRTIWFEPTAGIIIVSDANAPAAITVIASMSKPVYFKVSSSDTVADMMTWLSARPTEVSMVSISLVYIYIYICLRLWQYLKKDWLQITLNHYYTSIFVSW